MVRGAAKAASQERNAKKQAAMKKSGSQLGCGDAAMSTECTICKTKMPTLQNLKDHHLSKHSATPLPAGIEEGLKAQAAKKADDEKKKATKQKSDGGEKKAAKKKGGDADLSLLMEGLGTGPAPASRFVRRRAATRARARRRQEKKVSAARARVFRRTPAPAAASFKKMLWFFIRGRSP